jgi:hypothetical protein
LDFFFEDSDGFFLVVRDFIEENGIVEDEPESEAVDDVLLVILMSIVSQHFVVTVSLFVELESTFFILLALGACTEFSDISIDICFHFLEEYQGGYHTGCFDAVIINDIDLAQSFGDKVGKETDAVLVEVALFTFELGFV